MADSWLDAKYISLLSFRLRNFKKKNNQLWNFSCPLCGDSKTNPRKARGYVYSVKGTLRYHCHKCGVTTNVPNLIKHLDSNLYDEYNKESLISKYTEKKEHEEFVEKLKPPVFVSNTPLKELKKISQLKETNPAKIFVQNRLIPSHYHHKLFLALKFKAWVNSFIPGTYENIENDESRLIIPLLDRDKNLMGIQGRSFRKKTDLRYVTVMLPDKIKLFGLDTLDDTKHIYVVEGPIDSMFIPNALASAGGNIISSIDTLDIDRSQFTIVYDNEPRSATTYQKIKSAIDNNYKVCIWPSSVKEKDINDMILGGYTSEDVLNLINENTYQGLAAEFELNSWKRV